MDYSSDIVIKELELYLDSLNKLSMNIHSINVIKQIYQFHINSNDILSINHIVKLKICGQNTDCIKSILSLLELALKLYNSLHIDSEQHICRDLILQAYNDLDEIEMKIKKDIDITNEELKEIKGDYEAYLWKNQFDYNCKIFESRIDKITYRHSLIVKSYHEILTLREDLFNMSHTINLDNYKKEIEKHIELLQFILIEKDYIKEKLLNDIYDELELYNKLLITFEKFNKIINLRYIVPINEKLKVSKQIWYVIIYELSFLINKKDRLEWENKLLNNMHFNRISYRKHRNDSHKDFRERIRMILNFHNIKEFAQY